MTQLKLLKNGVEVNMKEEFLPAFCKTANSKCIFVARNEAMLARQAQKFAEAVQRETQADLISIDLSTASSANKTPADAIYDALTKLAADKDIAFDHGKSKILQIKELCEKLTIKNEAGLFAEPIIFIQHFQNCILTITTDNLSDYYCLREIPCKLIFTSNMLLDDIELALPINIGVSSVLRLLFERITIETDIPFKRREWKVACGLK